MDQSTPNVKLVLKQLRQQVDKGSKENVVGVVDGLSILVIDLVPRPNETRRKKKNNQNSKSLHKSLKRSRSSSFGARMSSTLLLGGTLKFVKGVSIALKPIEEEVVGSTPLEDLVLACIEMQS